MPILHFAHCVFIVCSGMLQILKNLTLFLACCQTGGDAWGMKGKGGWSHSLWLSKRFSRWVITPFARWITMVNKTCHNPLVVAWVEVQVFQRDNFLFFGTSQCTWFTSSCSASKLLTLWKNLEMVVWHEDQSEVLIGGDWFNTSIETSQALQDCHPRWWASKIKSYCDHAPGIAVHALASTSRQKTLTCVYSGLMRSIWFLRHSWRVLNVSLMLTSIYSSRSEEKWW